MANKIIIKKSSVASKVPVAGDLEVGELAVNLVDAKLYTKNAGGTVIQLGGGSGSGDVVGPSSATDNAVARYDATTGKLIQNSLVIIGDTGSVTGVNALTAESLTVNNNATLGSSNTDTLEVLSRITTDLEPNANNAKDIGTSGRNWRDGFFGRTLSTVNIEVTGTTSFDGSQGTSGQVLTSAGTGNTPTWTTPTTGTVTGVTATSPIASSGGTTPVISMPAATTSVNGYLTSTDWNTFNGKQAALVSGTNIKTVNGTTLLGSGNLAVGSVTSVAASVPTGLTVSGSPITGSGTLAITYTAGYAIPTTASQTNWDSAYTQRLQWDGGSTNLVASTGRTSLGATTLGSNIFTITNPSAITFPRFNANNTVSALSASDFRTAIGAGTGSGTVTSVTGGTYLTGGTITTSGTLAVDATSANTASKVVARDASGNFSAGTITATLSGNASSATTASQIDSIEFRNGNSTNGTAPDNVTDNGTGYTTSVSLFGQTDGALYSQAYSSLWVHQIFGDYRTGQLAVRGKNNGTWQAWRVQLDSTNYTSYAPSLTGSGASGTWGISISGNATTATTATTANGLNSSNSYTAVAFTATSDERLKTNWQDVDPDFVAKLANVKHGVYDRVDVETTQMGVSAQSLQSVAPRGVFEADGVLSVAYGNVALVAAIKLAQEIIELRKEIEELKKK